MQHCRTACVSVRRCNQVLIGAKHFSTTQVANEKHSCRVLVVGGGAGGCSLAAKFVTKVGKDQLIVIEPSDMHYYQPMFTLIGGGKKKLSQAGKHMGEVLPRNARWLKDSVAQFEPEQNRVVTTKGVTVEYDFMVVGAGIKLNYDQVPGLVEGLKMPKSGVCSNYSPDYVNLTHEALQRFDGGNAIFTFPNTPVKCAGAPQKIAYLSEEFLTKAGKRNKANIVYNTSLPVIFGVRKYADALSNVCERKNIKVNTQMELVEVKPEKKKAVFRDGKGSKHETEYELLHVTPPQGPVNALKNCKSLTDAAGFLDICPKTLRHSRFPNVYGVGDCTNAPTSKTGAAVAGQLGVIRRNLGADLRGDTGSTRAVYDGYTSCPLVTGYGKCIMAEFDYTLQPLETFPIDQSVERYPMYHLKATFMPLLYWNAMLRGYWEGPRLWRKALHLGFCK